MCPRDFNQKNSLDMHQRKHTGFKPHICQFCNLGFTQSGNHNSFLLCFLMCLKVLVNTLKTGCTNLMCPLKSILSWLNFTSKHATSLKSGFPKTKKAWYSGMWIPNLLFWPSVAISHSTHELKKNFQLFFNWKYALSECSVFRSPL